ncbi:MAG: hypothetical protein IT441_04740 [Phycisphaeraceae bacterium]|nr:hypothetical protein [Phycisphaeraceae bacterium]
MTLKNAGVGLLAAVVVLAGCSSFKPWDVFDRPRDPKVHVADVRVTERTEQGVRVELVLEMTNPNDEALPLVDVKYAVDLPGAGVKGFSTKDRPNMTLPAKGSQRLVLAAAFETNPQTAAIGAGNRYHVSGSITYRPPQTFVENLAEEALPLPSAGFSGKGILEEAPATQPAATEPAK